MIISVSLKLKALLITLVLAIPAFILGNVFWPPSPTLPAPTTSETPFLFILNILEVISFGLGFAFLIIGAQIANRVIGKNLLSKLTFISIAWILINWWPHDKLHSSIGYNIKDLLLIEYAFHVTLIAAGIILAYYFFTQVLKEKLT